MENLLLFLTLAVVGAATAALDPLPQLTIDVDTITVSGYSGGAAFAPQFHVAYSANISGSGAWSGWPNLCVTDPECSDPASYDVGPLVEKTLNLADSGLIDPVDYLKKQRAYIFTGILDNLVDPLNSKNMAEFFKAFMPEDQIRLEDTMPAGHSVVAENYGSECGTPNKLCVEDCDYDSMYHALDHLTGNGLLPSAHDFNESYFVEFDQNIYYSFDGNDAFTAAMGDIGYIFVPPRCYDYTVKCKLHVYFHGCGMNVPRWGYETWLEMVSGFFDVGTTNDIVILFPQTTSDYDLQGDDVHFAKAWGCWNTFGYLDDFEDMKFATKEAVQMKGVFRMIGAIVGW